MVSSGKRTSARLLGRPVAGSLPPEVESKREKRRRSVRRSGASGRPCPGARSRRRARFRRNATSRARSSICEMERLWPRVWQIACREEELPEVGDYVEYTIGDQSILVVRAAADTIRPSTTPACTAARASREGHGRFEAGHIRCRYHGWCYALDGRLTRRRRPRTSSAALPDDLRLGEVRVECWGGFVFVNMDPDAEPLLDFLDPLPALLAPYRLQRDALPLVPHDDHPGELEGRRRRVQRGLPRAGRAPADPAVDRRREHRVRAVRHALRTTAGCRTRAAVCSRARGSASPPDDDRRGRDPRRARRGSRRRVPQGGARARRGAALDAAAAGHEPAGAVPGAAHGAAALARLRRLRSRRPIR